MAKGNPIMERRHYVFVADVLRNADEPNALQRYWAREFADAFASDNPRFDRARFLKACGVED